VARTSLLVRAIQPRVNETIVHLPAQAPRSFGDLERVSPRKGRSARVAVRDFSRNDPPARNDNHHRHFEPERSPVAKSL
jgi:hypothetical protein